MAADPSFPVEPLDADAVIRSSIHPDEELWLISIPTNDFPLERLNDVSIHLDVESEEDTADDYGKFSTSITQIVGGLFPLIPSKKRLTFGSKLTGHVAFGKCVIIDEVKVPVSRKKAKLQVPSELHQRWAPFGMAKSSKSHKSKTKKKSRKTSE